MIRPDVLSSKIGFYSDFIDKILLTAVTTYVTIKNSNILSGWQTNTNYFNKIRHGDKGEPANDLSRVFRTVDALYTPEQGCTSPSSGMEP